jgi:hypothetical protein
VIVEGVEGVGCVTQHFWKWKHGVEETLRSSHFKCWVECFVLFLVLVSFASMFPTFFV